jgi:hypothetical protein
VNHLVYLAHSCYLFFALGFKHILIYLSNILVGCKSFNLKYLCLIS